MLTGHASRNHEAEFQQPVGESIPVFARRKNQYYLSQHDSLLSDTYHGSFAPPSTVLLHLPPHIENQPNLSGPLNSPTFLCCSASALRKRWSNSPSRHSRHTNLPPSCVVVVFGARPPRCLPLTAFSTRTTIHSRWSENCPEGTTLHWSSMLVIRLDAPCPHPQDDP
ncbi:hypothetical protein BD779DRAFT_799652 [Infundibulicybe gibba]|nr:hypothetical protein BD779DRAFT_799652 [Infundibulicybe gibba]